MRFAQVTKNIPKDNMNTLYYGDNLEIKIGGKNGKMCKLWN